MSDVRQVRDVLLHDAELEDGRRADVRVTGGRITDIAPSLLRGPGEETVDCGGGVLLPGLADHHLHLHALAADRRSVPCGPDAVGGRIGLVAALASAPADEHGWVRGVGYHETVAGDLDAAALDRIHSRRPLRLQHRSGALWILNSFATQSLSLAQGDHPGIERDASGSPTGRLWRADSWLRDRLPRTRLPDLTAIGRELARLGVTAVTDATPDLAPKSLSAIADSVATGRLPQRVHLLGMPLGGPMNDAARPQRVTVGPYKIVLADSGLPALDDLVERIRAAHRSGRAVAVHVVTREALVLLLVALQETGTARGDRIEHAALVPRDLIGDIAALGLRVVTQPAFLAHRGDDYARDIPAAEHCDLYRCRSLAAAGVPVALSSDAPYGPLDPWAVVTAAVRRRTARGQVLTPQEGLAPAAALDALLAPPDDPGGAPRRVRIGSAADLVLLHVGRDELLAAPSAEAVRTTFIGAEDFRLPSP
ncbi:amidohydrolase family protein [Streptomyces sp. NPDC057690]|uniref:amidohydrolase family protein n=1 Tax=Streptomyces sp. NPDC057690 TaxID=3346214 RepID=UPI003680F00C